MTKDQALELLRSKMENVNLRRHSYAVGAVMKALSIKIEGSEQSDWEIAGILHDMDYEITKDDHSKHTKLAVSCLDEVGVSNEIKNAILAHAWGYVEGNPKPKSSMEWSIYCCDELTGLIVACALVKPSKKISDVTVDTVLGKWNQRSFAAGVNRNQIAICEEKLGIPLKEFIAISLMAMQNIHSDLGL